METKNKVSFVEAYGPLRTGKEYHVVERKVDHVVVKVHGHNYNVPNALIKKETNDH